MIAESAEKNKIGQENERRAPEELASLSGKNILITGGASGLGYAFLSSFLHCGAHKVCFVDVDESTGRHVAIGLDKSHGPGRATFLHADVSKSQEISVAFAEAVKLMGSLDIVVNNAGILDERRWEREIAINMGGMISVAMLSMKHMGRDSGGRGGLLVNVAEHVDVRRTAQLPVYSATKQAVIGLSQSLAAPCNAQRTGVRVVTLCPGLTETPLTVDSPNKLLSRVMKADFVKNLDQIAIQTPYVVAQGLLSILSVAKTGSIWVIESGRPPREVCLPESRTLRRVYKNNVVKEETTKVDEPEGRPIREVCDNTRTGLASCA